MIKVPLQFPMIMLFKSISQTVTVSTKTVGVITRIAGPLVQASGMSGVRLYDVARVGKLALIGEIIKIEEDIVSIQCYENTDGIFPGEDVVGIGEPLSVLLGPGLMSQIYDGTLII